MLLFMPAPAGGSGGGLTGGSTASIGTVDAYVDMNVANAAGTVLTTTILGNGTVGLANTTGWSLHPDPTIMLVGAHDSSRALPGSVIVDEVTYPTSHTSKSFAYDHQYTFKQLYIGIPAGHRLLTLAGWITFGPPKVASGSASIF